MNQFFKITMICGLVAVMLFSVQEQAEAQRRGGRSRSGNYQRTNARGQSTNGTWQGHRNWERGKGYRKSQASKPRRPEERSPASATAALNERATTPIIGVGIRPKPDQTATLGPGKARVPAQWSAPTTDIPIATKAPPPRLEAKNTAWTKRPHEVKPMTDGRNPPIELSPTPTVT